MVVTDGAGRPVSGLTRQDFAVTDNKQPQPILTFKAVAGAPRADAPQQAIFVIDEVNAAFLDVSRARDELSGFLRRNGGSLPMSATILLRTDTGVTMSGSPRAMERPLLMISMGQLRDSFGTASGQHRDYAPSVGRRGFYGAADRLNLSIQAITSLTRYEAKQPAKSW